MDPFPMKEEVGVIYVDVACNFAIVHIFIVTTCLSLSK